ncbi:MAG: aspartate 1-decarboxylase [Bdellovibrionaceae bacterium]|nr:aspartate 1-decarboxylase [Pseudobdellovibrionaceae bacterium]NUM58900.1 aspartate 1-decarboxylase [Pseudobdellovibrionaceae bacterium]
MELTLLKSKIHRATVTEADLTYEGSVSIDPELITAANLLLHEKVDILNCNNGERFSTYVIKGKKGQICLNGAAARLVQKGDIVIIVAYCQLNEEAAKKHKPHVVFVDHKNRIKEKRVEKANKKSKY